VARIELEKTKNRVSAIFLRVSEIHTFGENHEDGNPNKIIRHTQQLTMMVIMNMASRNSAAYTGNYGDDGRT
jgi:hypothetical protein